MLTEDGAGVAGGWFVELLDIPAPAMVKNKQAAMIGRRRRQTRSSRWVVSGDADGIKYCLFVNGIFFVLYLFFV